MGQAVAVAEEKVLGQVHTQQQLAVPAARQATRSALEYQCLRVCQAVAVAERKVVGQVHTQQQLAVPAARQAKGSALEYQCLCVRQAVAVAENAFLVRCTPSSSLRYLQEQQFTSPTDEFLLWMLLHSAKKFMHVKFTHISSLRCLRGKPMFTPATGLTLHSNVCAAAMRCM
jgi:hypothetical protein